MDIISKMPSCIADCSEKKAAAGMYGIASHWPEVVIQGTQWSVGLGMWSMRQVGGLLSRVEGTVKMAFLGPNSKKSTNEEQTTPPFGWGFVVRGGKWGVHFGKRSVSQVSGYLERLDNNVTTAVFGANSKLSLRHQLAALPVLGLSGEMAFRYFEKVPVTLRGGSSKTENFFEDDRWVIEKCQQEKKSIASRMPKALMQIIFGAGFTGIAALTYKGWHDNVLSEGCERLAAIADLSVALAVLVRLGLTIKRATNLGNRSDRFPERVFEDVNWTVSRVPPIG